MHDNTVIKDNFVTSDNKSMINVNSFVMNGNFITNDKFVMGCNLTVGIQRWSCKDACKRANRTTIWMFTGLNVLWILQTFSQIPKFKVFCQAIIHVWLHKFHSICQIGRNCSPDVALYPIVYGGKPTKNGLPEWFGNWLSSWSLDFFLSSTRTNLLHSGLARSSIHALTYHCEYTIVLRRPFLLIIVQCFVLEMLYDVP